MYSSPALLGRKDILLWCDGRPEDSDFDNSRKKRARCHSPLTRRDDREAQVDELVEECTEEECAVRIITILNHSIECRQGWFKIASKDSSL